MNSLYLILTIFFLFSNCSTSNAFTSTTTEQKLEPSTHKYSPMFCRETGELDARLLVNYYKQDSLITSRRKNAFENNMEYPKLTVSCLKHRKNYIKGFREGYTKSLQAISGSSDLKCFRRLEKLREAEISYVHQSLYSYNPNTLTLDAKHNSLQRSLQTFSQSCKGYDKTSAVVAEVKKLIRALKQ